MDAKTIQVICDVCAVISVLVVLARTAKGHSNHAYIDYLCFAVIIVGILGSFNVQGFTDKLAQATGGKPFPTVSTVEKAHQQEIRIANEKERLRQERNNRATEIIQETTYIEYQLPIGGPICFAVYRDQLGGQVDCKIIPPELLGIADVK